MTYAHRMFEYQATVIRVVDGDTIDLMIDQGLETYKKSRIRLAGLDAAEHGTVKGEEATAWLTKRLPIGGVLRIQTIKDRKEKYGRYLGLLFEPVNVTRSVNDELLTFHQANAWYGRGPKPT